MIATKNNLKEELKKLQQNFDEYYFAHLHPREFPVISEECLKAEISKSFRSVRTQQILSATVSLSPLGKLDLECFRKVGSPVRSLDSSLEPLHIHNQLSGCVEDIPDDVFMNIDLNRKLSSLMDFVSWSFVQDLIGHSIKKRNIPG
jgi:chemotaxis regulatin CheY-phosphate phosphatase CheZ